MLATSPLARRAAVQSLQIARVLMMRFVLFLALAIAGLAIIAAFATGGETVADVSQYDYRASLDPALPFARRPRSPGEGRMQVR